MCCNWNFKIISIKQIKINDKLKKIFANTIEFDEANEYLSK